MGLDSLHELWIHELENLRGAESRIAEALPAIIAAATRQDLRSALEAHLQQSRRHLARLERIFEGLDGTAAGQRCRGMDGLIEESRGSARGRRGRARARRRDHLFVAAHRALCRIASCGTVSAFAEMLGEHAAAALLQQTLDEESAVDTQLSRLARKRVDFDALFAFRP